MREQIEFPGEFKPESVTSAPERADEEDLHDVRKQMQSAVSRYELAKPKRIVLRGRLIND